MASTVASGQSAEQMIDPELEARVRDEIRIVQTVQNQAALPGVIGGNLLVIFLTLSLDWRAVISSGAVYSMACQLILLGTFAHRYHLLLGKPRPKFVRPRTIRILWGSALVLGVIWSVTAWLMIGALSPEKAALLMMILISISITGALTLVSLPCGALGFFVPLMATIFVAAILNEVASTGWLVTVGIAGILGVTRFILEGWRVTLSNTRLRLMSVQAQADRAELLEKLSSELGKYMSPQLYASIFSGDQKVEVSSKRKKLTVFFSDIANFTEITDQLESEELTALLNRYLTEMSTIALEHGGTIDKFIGDAIVVYFGDPASRGVKEDAYQCVRMALAMQKRVRALGQEWLDMGLERTFELRIGINTGYCTVGNFGSEDRMDYTIIGSEVNLAARLESAAEVGGILLANETHSLVSDWVVAEEGVPITVKGFPRPVKTFSVKGVQDGEGVESNLVSHAAEGVAVEIDLDRIAEEQKEEAAQALEKALARLRST
ncbi:adenylate/guanylate cyclase domain-containing protein [uncultured Shimia sp.]|uniref:adenylate/guanylate cyclase domain-containing protein n=1 Tax=uncultured Shimia sp. TaxID=573152 RepID=UPI0026186DEE|nr:adenylate/guanylate cyclase domain-containing protein [uncultured Shimia sp.]